MPKPNPASSFSRRIHDIDGGVYEDFETSPGLSGSRRSDSRRASSSAAIHAARLGAVLGISRSCVVQLIRALDERGWIARRIRATRASYPLCQGRERSALVDLLDRLGPPVHRPRLMGK